MMWLYVLLVAVVLIEVVDNFTPKMLEVARAAADMQRTMQQVADVWARTTRPGALADLEEQLRKLRGKEIR